MESRNRWSALGSGDLTKALQAQRAGKRRIVFLILSALTVLGWLYVIFFSSLFTLREVQGEGLKTVDATDLTKEVFAILDERGDSSIIEKLIPSRNLLLFNAEYLKEALQGRLFIAQVTVDKVGFNILRLKIEERPKKFVLHSKQQYVWVDLRGLVIKELDADEKRFVQARLLGQRQLDSDESPVIKKDSDEQLEAGFEVFKEEATRKWVELSDEFLRLGLMYREFEPPPEGTTKLRLLAQEGFKVIMDTSVSLKSQINNYLAFVKSKPRDIEPTKTEYVDVSVPGKVFVK